MQILSSLERMEPSLLKHNWNFYTDTYIILALPAKYCFCAISLPCYQFFKSELQNITEVPVLNCSKKFVRAVGCPLVPAHYLSIFQDTLSAVRREWRAGACGALSAIQLIGWQESPCAAATQWNVSLDHRTAQCARSSCNFRLRALLTKFIHL